MLKIEVPIRVHCSICHADISNEATSVEPSDEYPVNKIIVAPCACLRKSSEASSKEVITPAPEPDNAELRQRIRIAEAHKGELIRLDYMNWRGKRRQPTLLVKEVWYGRTKYHPKAQWFIHGFCRERWDKRDYAIKDILQIWANEMPVVTHTNGGKP
jgi:hypothetical protein